MSTFFFHAASVTNNACAYTISGPPSVQVHVMSTYAQLRSEFSQLLSLTSTGVKNSKIIIDRISEWWQVSLPNSKTGHTEEKAMGVSIDEALNSQ